jgi:thiol:disulfide interchange protein DsbC
MKMNSLRLAWTGLLLGLAMLCNTVTAQTLASSEAAVAERLQALYPATRFGEVSPTPWAGVFEVGMGNNLAYVDESGRYFLFGHLYDMSVQLDLTAERRDAVGRIDFASLPLGDALREVRGSGARSFAIFSDPDCPYCRRLEAEIRTLTDVTIYTFLMPIASLHPEAHGKAVAVWCSSDRIAAWHALMWRDEAMPARDCANPVDRNIALGERLGIAGTPTLVAADGRMLPGAASLAQVDSWLGRTTASAMGSPRAGELPR